MFLYVSDKKAKAIEKYLRETPISVGETVYVKGKNSSTAFTVTEVVGNEVRVNAYKPNGGELVPVENIIRQTYFIGADPFTDDNRYNRNYNFTLDSILYRLGLVEGETRRSGGGKSVVAGVVVEEANFNPFVITKKGKEYYQRGSVWTLEQKQALVESVYEGIGLGTMLVRHNSFETLERLISEGHTDVAHWDVVDGKQRINALADFVNGKFQDFHGNYYSDLSAKAMNTFCSGQLLSYVEISEDASDDYVIRQFLRANFAGVPQSKEHIDYVRSINSHF